MVYENIEFHNVEQLEHKEGINGVFLQRFPEALRNSLGHTDNTRGRYFSQLSQGCEIRFVTSSPFFRISLSSWEAEGQISVYAGDFYHSTHKINQGGVNTIHLEYPQRLKGINKSVFEKGRFAPNVWRICFDKESCYGFNGLDCFGYDYRAPFESEKPEYRWLAYGSSITTGSRCQRYKNCYTERAAKILGIDVLNKGITGTCFMEAQIASFLSELQDWDMASLELGINMVLSFNALEFAKRAENILVRFARRQKPVFVIGVLPAYNTYCLTESFNAKMKEFNRILEEKTALVNSPYIYYFEPEKMLDDFTALGCDLVHPSDDGHIIMGDNFSRLVKEKIGL